MPHSCRADCAPRLCALIGCGGGRDDGNRHRVRLRAAITRVTTNPRAIRRGQLNIVILLARELRDTQAHYVGARRRRIMAICAEAPAAVSSSLNLEDCHHISVNPAISPQTSRRHGTLCHAVDGWREPPVLDALGRTATPSRIHPKPWRVSRSSCSTGLALRRPGGGFPQLIRLRCSTPVRPHSRHPRSSCRSIIAPARPPPGAPVAFAAVRCHCIALTERSASAADDNGRGRRGNGRRAIRRRSRISRFMRSPTSSTNRCETQRGRRHAEHASRAARRRRA